VYVIKPDLTVELRSVVPERTFNDITVIGKGLAAGEKVVVEGQLRLTPGAKVEIKPPAAEQAEKKNKSQETNPE
jgi:multidrug efflux system membrane fusion protein